MLANGDYTLEIKATDVDDNLTTTLDKNVTVTGKLKLGNLHQEFNDLSISVAGMSITVSRVYDSTNSGTVGDFGYGWRMAIADTKIDVSATGGNGWGAYPAFVNGTRVIVTLPTGQRAGFTFQPVPQAYDSFGLITLWHPNFVPDPGVYGLLTAPDVLLTQDLTTGQYYIIADSGDIVTYNPADPTFGDQYTYKNIFGIGYDIEAQGGHLQDTSNRNGVKLTYSNSGIQSSSGKQVTFTRDVQGRITAITDPNGKSLLYGYDILGNLVSVTDRRGKVTQYQYTLTGYPHFLTQIMNSLGVVVMKAQFDSTGRLSGITDAKGNVTPISYNLTYGTNRFQETVTDPLSHASNSVYDQFGNIVTTTDALNHSHSYGYDTNNNVTTVTDALSYAENYTYDSLGRPQTFKDRNGNTSYLTFDSSSDLLTQSDQLGDTVTNSYDSSGDLLSSTNPLGQKMSYQYDPQGMPTAIIDNAGNIIKKMGFNTSGDPIKITDAAGSVLNRVYDQDGNRTNESYTWINPNNPNDVHTETNLANYNEAGQITTTTNADNLTATAVYDDNGNTTQFTNNFGLTETRTFDAAGNLIQVQNADGTIVQTVYDQLNRPTVTTNPYVPGTQTDGHRVIYDNAGRVIEKDRLSNVVVQLQPDTYNTGQYISVLVSYGSVIAAAIDNYDADGRLSQSIEPDGMVTNYQYDGLGQETSFTVDALGLAYQTQYFYDAAGHQIRIHDALGHDTQMVYDALGRAVKTIFPDGTFATESYNTLGELISQTDQAGNTTQFQYDTAGRKTAVILPPVPDPENGGVYVNPKYQYQYDIYGDLLTFTDPKGRQTRYTYDPQGRQLTLTYPNGQVETNSYDSKGRLYRHTDADGQITEYLYDSLNRLQTKNLYAIGAQTPTQTVSYSYDSLGRLHQVVDATGTTVYLYDSQNNLTQVSSPEGIVNYSYDLVMERLTRTYTGNPSSPSSDYRYVYDSIGRLSTVTAVMQGGQAVPTNLQTTSYIYNADDQPTSVALPNGVTISYLYDPDGHLTDVNTNGPSGLISSYHYTLDPTGERIAVTENNQGTTRTVGYTYDSLYRLLSENINNGAQTISYSYDIVGNRLQRIDSAGGTTNYVYDSDNRLQTETTGNDVKSYLYDPNGSMTQMTETVNGTQTQQITYGYDLQSRLVTVGNTTYQYDDSGNLVSVTTGGVTTLYLEDDNSPSGLPQILEEKTASGSVIAAYLYGDQLLSQLRGTQTSFYIVDGLGSTRALTNTSGTVTDTYIYDAYGKMLSQIGTTTNFYLFAGQRFDPVLGFYYDRARYYNQSNGTFTQADPLKGTDVGTANWYAYTNGNPVNRTDPTGLFDFSFITFLQIFGWGMNIYGLASQTWGLGAKIMQLLDIRDFVMDIRRLTDADILQYEDFDSMQRQAVLAAIHLIFDAMQATVQLSADVLSTFSYGGELFSFFAGGAYSDEAVAETKLDGDTLTMDIDLGQASEKHHYFFKVFEGLLGVKKDIQPLYDIGKKDHDVLHALLISNGKGKKGYPLNQFRDVFPYRGNSAAKILARYKGREKDLLVRMRKGYEEAAKFDPRFNEIIKGSGGVRPTFDDAIQALINGKVFPGITWP